MSESPEDKALATMKKAQQLVDEVKRQLEDGENFFRSSGLNREKVNSFCEKSMSAEDRRKADELIAKDLAEIDDEVLQARLQNDDSGGGGKVKRPRSMV